MVVCGSRSAMTIASPWVIEKHHRNLKCGATGNRPVSFRWFHVLSFYPLDAAEFDYLIGRKLFRHFFFFEHVNRLWSNENVVCGKYLTGRNKPDSDKWQDIKSLLNNKSFGLCKGVESRPEASFWNRRLSERNSIYLPLLKARTVRLFKLTDSESLDV